MAILTRVSRLLAADLHAVIDRLEEPQAQLQQAMREMQQLTAQLQHEQEQGAATIARLTEQKQNLIEQQTTTMQELELCLDAGEEALARAVVRQTLQLDKLLEQIDRERKLAQAQQQTQNAMLTDHQAQLESLTAQAELLDVTRRDSPSSGKATNIAAAGITEAQIDIALLAHQRRRAKS